MTGQIRLALGLAIAALLFGSGWMVHSWYTASVAAQIRRVADEVSRTTASQIASIKVENKTTYARTVEKITTEVQYRECKQDETMLSLTNKAITGK